MIWLPVFMPPARAAVVPTASTEPTTAVVISFQAPTSACEHAVDSTFWGVSKPGFRLSNVLGLRCGTCHRTA